MKKTIYCRAIVYARQDVDFESVAELENKAEELEQRIRLDVDFLQDGGCSQYDYCLGDVEAMNEEDFPHYLFE